MQSDRGDLVAVRVPGHGILAIGGWSVTKGGLADVELLQLSSDDEEVTSWRRMAPLLRPKMEPSACYFGDSVFVCCRQDDLDLERFDVEAGATGQWTRIACHFRYKECRSLLPLSGSLWIIGDLNA